jgi:membrane-associated phospholipid phosphatase
VVGNDLEWLRLARVYSLDAAFFCNCHLTLAHFYSHASKEYTLYSLGGSCLTLTIVLLAFFQTPAIAQKTLQAGFLSILVGSVFNRFVNKLSLHVLTVAGCAVVLYFVSPFAGIVLGLISLLVAWSRVHLTRHTAPEVIWGWVVGLTCTIIWFFISRQFYVTPS